MVSKKTRIIRLAKPYFKDRDLLLKLVDEILENGYLVQGKYVGQFEKIIADYLGVKHAIAVSSGTAALHLALLASGVSSENEVIVPAFTFPATANVVELIKARLRLVDVNLETYNIDVNTIEEAVTPKTKAIIPVHLFGNPADMIIVMEIAEKYNLKVIEDAAGALGAKYGGKKCGTIGDLACFSFHPRKILTTGEGGLLVTNDYELAEKVMVLRDHGSASKGKKRDFIAAGFNYRMNELEAVLGLEQAKRIDEIVRERVELANLYKSFLAGVEEIYPQKVLLNCTSAYQAFVARLADSLNRDSIIDELKTIGVEVGMGAYALHVLSYFRNKYGFTEKEYSNAAKLHNQGLALPLYNRMNHEEIEFVIRALRGKLG